MNSASDFGYSIDGQLPVASLPAPKTMTVTSSEPAEAFEPLTPDDFEVEKDGTTLHVMRFANGNACVIERGPNGEGPDKGSFAPYHNVAMDAAQRQMIADGWSLKTTKQMTVTDRSHGYNNTTVSGVCSPDVTVEDVKKRFYHSYFGGREAWVRDGRFGCVIYTD